MKEEVSLPTCNKGDTISMNQAPLGLDKKNSLLLELVIIVGNDFWEFFPLPTWQKKVVKNVIRIKIEDNNLRLRNNNDNDKEHFQTKWKL